MADKSPKNDVADRIERIRNAFAATQKSAAGDGEGDGDKPDGEKPDGERIIANPFEQFPNWKNFHDFKQWNQQVAWGKHGETWNKQPAVWNKQPAWNKQPWKNVFE